MMNRKPSALKMARLARGLHLSDVALTLGVTKQAVSMWELGKRKPQPSVVKELARIYGVRAKNLAC